MGSKESAVCIFWFSRWPAHCSSCGAPGLLLLCCLLLSPAQPTHTFLTAFYRAEDGRGRPAEAWPSVCLDVFVSAPGPQDHSPVFLAQDSHVPGMGHRPCMAVMVACSDDSSRAPGTVRTGLPCGCHLPCLGSPHVLSGFELICGLRPSSPCSSPPGVPCLLLSLHSLGTCCSARSGSLVLGIQWVNPGGQWIKSLFPKCQGLEGCSAFASVGQQAGPLPVRCTVTLYSLDSIAAKPRDASSCGEDGKSQVSSGRSSRGWGGRRRNPRPLHNVCAQRLHCIQPLNLHQLGEEFRDAVARRADAVKELHAICHAPNLIPLQPKALCQMAPGLHHGLLRVVCGAEHAARLLQAVEGQLRGAEAWRA